MDTHDVLSPLSHKEDAPVSQQIIYKEEKKWSLPDHNKW